MAQILPQNSAPPANPAAARLEATLASLPDEWALLPRRRIGGADGPEVGFVLIHPAIGIALVDLLPRTPDAAADRLRGLLDDEQVAGASDALPVVGVALDPEDIPSVGERLAAAFELEPLCDVADGDWPRRAIDLLLTAGDAAMLPLTVRAAAPEPAADYHDPAPLAADEPAILSAPSGRHVTFAAICAVIIALIGIGGSAAYLLTQRPADAPVAAAATPPSAPLPMPVIPPVATAEAPPPAPAAAPAAPAAPTGPVALPTAPPAPPPPDKTALAPPPTPAPTVADTSPPAAVSPPAPDRIAGPVIPRPPAPRAATASPPRDKRARMPVAVAAKETAKHVKAPPKRVAAADRPSRPNLDEAFVAPPQRIPNDAPRRQQSKAPTDEVDAIDAADLPPLESASLPPPPPAAPLAAPLPSPAPFPRAAVPPPFPSTAAANGAPVMLLPPIVAQTAPDRP